MPGANEERLSTKQREQMIEANRPLVYWVARRWAGSASGRGVEWDDLCQVGMLGLIKAVDNFRSESGCQFSTYAVPMIMGELRRYFRDNTMLHVSRGYKELLGRVRRAAAEWQKAQGQEATVGQLAEALGLAPEKIAEVLAAGAEPVSLQQELASGAELLERLPAAEPDEESWVQQLALREGLAALPARLQYIIKARFFEEQTQEVVAGRLGVSQVQVSRLEKQALRQLRRLL